jgi:hypothetical protein
MRAFVLYCCLCLLAPGLSWAEEENSPPIDGIMDNSFLVEEAYNQEPGIVQHIFTGAYSVDRISNTAERRLDFSFTQEWPVFGQTHQFSYTIPYSVVKDSGHWENGIGDVLLNYRYQAYFDEKSLTALAPRFSLVLPTGDERKEFGNGTLGYQWNLPFSTTFGDRWFAHANAGLTFLPSAGLKPGHDLLNYNLGGSVIYCANRRLNFMLEWVGAWNQGLRGSRVEDHIFLSVLSPGIRYAFNLAEETQIVIGFGVPIGLNRDTPELAGLLYFSFESRMFGKKQP